MTGRTKLLDEAIRRAGRRLGEHVADLREARLSAGLRQKDVARALGWSPARVGRAERAETSDIGVRDLAAHASVVGLAFSTSLVPAPGRLRDAGQLRFINAYTAVVAGGGWRPQVEAPVGEPGDPRAFDLLMVRGHLRVAHEFVTRLRDVQAQVRPMLRKADDARVNALVLVLADTRANRAAVREAGAVLRITFPLSTRATLAAMRAGRAPPANGLVLQRALPAARAR